MSNIFKRIISLFLVLSMCFTMVSTVAFATVAAIGSTLLALLSAAGFSAVSGFAWTAGSGLADSLFSTEVEYYSTDSGSTTYNLANYGDTVTSTGTDYSYVYNGSSSTSTTTNNTSYYQAIDTTNNTYYNTYTETYNTYNDITYNSEYNTYYITEEYYDVYITNNYTYVTYIVEDTTTLSTYYYEIYYMLPDGRNSYTLSAEDVWGEYFIYDVVNYDYVAEDDGTTLGLWHLDEDLKDSSYWNNTGSTALLYNYSEALFDSGWYNSSASVYSTLSLSLSDVDFDLDSDWTLEYACYVPSTAALTNGSYTYYYYSFGYFLFNGDTYLITTSTLYMNTWVRIAIVHEDGVLSCYLNGSLYSTDISPTSTVVSYPTLCIYSDSISFGRGQSNFVTGSYKYDYHSYLATYDEVRLSSSALYTDDYYVFSSVPFDTNMVMVVPTDVRENTICIQALYDINDVRIGGVRSTYPTTGDVYVYLEDNEVVSVQQYQENAWYTVDATIYADGTYTSLYGYDMSTYEITEPDADTTTDGDSDTGDGDSTTDPDSDGDGEVSADEASSWLTDIIDSVFSGLFSILTTILGYVDELVTAVCSLLDIILGVFTNITDFGGEFTSLLGAFFDWMPTEILVLLELSIALPLLFMIIKFFAGLFL